MLIFHGCEFVCLMVGHLIQRHLKIVALIPRDNYSFIFLYFHVVFSLADQACCLHSCEPLSGKPACNPPHRCCAHLPIMYRVRAHTLPKQALPIRVHVWHFPHLLWLCLACSWISFWSESSRLNLICLSWGDTSHIDIFN